MEDRVMTSLAMPRLSALVLVAFGVFASLVAAVGLFAVMSFTVTQRTREIGVRSALGAQRRDIVSLVLRQAVWIAGIGIAAGLGTAAAASRLLSRFLYGIGPHDLATFAGAAVTIAVIAALACLLPARRAARIDPLIALRRR
jgi:ABC-type antimicrobial peptide transport system permease subunit